MARTPFLKSFVASTTYTIPPGRHLIATFFSMSSSGGVTIDGVALPYQVGVPQHPFVFPAGTTLAATSNFGVGWISGFLYDN